MKILKVAPVAVVGLLVLFNFSPLLDLGSDAQVVKHFTNNKTYGEITFESAGEKTELWMRLPQGSVVKEVHVNITGKDDGNGNYPLNPKLDLGGDGDIEWGFNVSGYGAMGHQTVLSSNDPSISMTFKSAGSSSNGRIILPQTAELSSAGVTLTGQKTDFGIKTVMENNKDRISDMETADIDNDGDMDIVICVYGDGDIIWYNNTNGDGTSWTKKTIESSFAWIWDLGITDLNGDGTLDIVASSWWPGELAWYDNQDGIGQSWSTRKTIDNNTRSITAIKVGDMDNDGDLDLVTTRRGTNGRVDWYDNTAGNATAWTRHTISGASAGAEELALFDIDSDGDNDTVVVNFNYDDLLWYENINNASSWSSVQVISNNGMNDGVSVITHDVNEDNLTDIVVLGSQLRWFEHPGNLSNSWTSHYISTPGMTGSLGEVVTADMGYYGNEPDGHLDLAIATTWSNSIIWYEANGANPGSSWSTHLIRNNIDARCIKVLDIGGKHYPDMIASIYSGTSDNLAWYELNMSYPKNVKLDVGGDGDIEYTPGSGFLQSSKITGDFSNELEQLLTAGSPSTDSFGNKVLEIPLKISTDMPGIITLSGVNMFYDYTAMARTFPSGTLATEVQSHIGAAGTGSGKTNVPLKFTTESAGTLRVWDVYYEFNDYPELLSNIPSLASIEEDTKVDTVVDLHPYFKDDYLDSEDLTYDVVSYTNDDIVTVYITDSHYIGIDSESGDANDDWVGDTKITVRARDDENLPVLSNTFSINVTQVNDEPRNGPDSLPVINMKEGLKSDPIFLVGSNLYFLDVENDDLYFDVELDPEDVYIDEELELEIDEVAWSVRIKALGNWVGQNVPLRIYCDDDPEVDRTVYRDTLINVQDVDDDPPIWQPIPELKFNEGSRINDLNNIIQLTDYINDIDDSIFSIIFSVVDYTNSTALDLLVDSQAYLDMSLKDDNFNGMTTVTLRAEDPGGNYADTIIDIIILPVNDPPSISLKTPAQDAIVLTDSVRLTWEGHDVDSDDSTLTYTVFFDEVSGITPTDAQNIKGTSMWVDGLENGLTYFWTVSSSDGQSTGESEQFSFFVIYGEVPTTTLIRPGNNGIVNNGSITLEWSYDYKGTDVFTPKFDLYFGSKEDIVDGDFSFSDPYLKDLEITETNIAGLKDGMAYYWKVVPKTGDGTEGKCLSGVWSFKVDFSAISYKFKLELDDPTASVKRGELYSTQFSLTNLGSNRDVIQFELLTSITGIKIAIIELGDDWIFTLQPGETVQLNLTIDATTAPVSSSKLIIRATSTGDGSVHEETLDLTVNKPDEDPNKVEDQLFSSTTLIMIIAVIVTIVILIVIFFMMNRKKNKDELEPIDDMPVSGAYGQPMMLDAELVSGPMSIGDVSRPGGPGIPGPRAIAGPTAPGAPGRPGVRRLPPPKAGSVVRKKKRAKPRPGEIEDFGVAAPMPTAAESPTGPLFGETPLEFSKPGAADTGLDQAQTSPDDGLSFKRPDEVEKKTEEDRSKRGPKVRLPGE